MLARTPREVAQMPADDVQKLVHELQVHQIELEMQNDELRRTQEQLESAREKLLLPYDVAPVGFLTLDGKGVIQEANLAAARMLNFDRVKLSGQKLTHFIAPESQDIFYLHRRQLAGTGEKQTCELHLSRMDGSQFIARLESVIEQISSEPTARSLVVMSDITAQKQAEEIIRDHEIQLRLITDMTPVMLTRWSRDLHYRFVNRACAEFLGLAPEAIMGKPIAEVIGAEAFEAIRPHLEKVLQGQRIEFEGVVPYARAGARFVRVIYTPEWDEHGEVRGAVGSITDLTERKRAEAALRESEARFGRMADAAPVLIWISGTDKLCIYFNKPWLEFTGRTLEQELGHGWAEGVHPDDLQRCLKIYTESFDARLEFRMEYRLKRHDGEYRWILDHGIPRFDDGQKFLGYIGSCVDITERRLMEEALQQAHDKLEERVRERTKELTFANNALHEEKAFSDSLIELAPAVIAVIDGLGNLIRTNAFTEQLTGYPAAEMRGRNMIEMFVPAEARPRVRRRLREGLQGAAAGETIAPLRTRAGDIRQIEWFSKPLPNAKGKLNAMMVVGHDITERLEILRALHASETKFRGFVESAPDGIVAVNPQGQIVLVNAQVGRLFGYRTAELTGQPLEWLLPERFRARHAVHFKNFFAAPHARPMGTGLELAARRKDGSEFPVEITLSPVATEEGTLVFSAIRDITERKQAEEALRRSERHLANFFEQAPIGLAWLSAGGSILRANHAQLNLLDCPSENCLGHVLTEFLAEPSHGNELLKSLADRQTVRNLRLQLRGPRGAGRHVLVDANSSWNGNEFEYSSIFLRDITDRVSLEQEILHISEREHRRIAQDLHDGLGQLLVGAAYLAGTLRQDLAAKSRPEARKLRRIEEVLNEALSQTRNLASGLHPVEPEPNGLMAALETLAVRTKKLFQIHCQFICRRPVLVKEDAVATHLFRIAQEAVTNAIKHGKPGRIEISLTETPGHISLAVKDDGSGIPVQQRKKAGMGLRIMRYRAGMIGGSLAIQKEPAGGTTVVCTVHLANQKLPQPKLVGGSRKSNLRKE